MAISTPSTARTATTARSAGAMIRPSKGTAARRQPQGYDLREWAEKFDMSVDELRQLVASYMKVKLGASLSQMHN